MKVYELGTDADRFRILEFVDPGDSDRLADQLRHPCHSPTKLPSCVRLSSSPPAAADSDLPSLAPFAPCYSARAIEDLGEERLLRAGRLLKLNCSAEDYWLHQVDLRRDLLNDEQSECVREPGQNAIMWISRFAFRPEFLEGAFIFRLEQAPLSRVLVTDEFRQRAKGLRGFHLREVWPQSARDSRFRGV